PPMDLRYLQAGIDRCLDHGEVAVAAETVEERAQVGEGGLSHAGESIHSSRMAQLKETEPWPKPCPPPPPRRPRGPPLAGAAGSPGRSCCSSSLSSWRSSWCSGRAPCGSARRSGRACRGST